jgi:hypothetical protein
LKSSRKNLGSCQEKAIGEERLSPDQGIIMNPAEEKSKEVDRLEQELKDKANLKHWMALDATSQSDKTNISEQLAIELHEMWHAIRDLQNERAVERKKRK